jgi:predicted dinucleotide-binding enzyme
MTTYNAVALGTGVSAGMVAETAKAGIVVLAVPWPSVPAAVAGAER